MDLLRQVFEWLTDPANWSGSDGIWAHTVEHVTVSAAGVAAGIAVALPVGMLIGHTRKGAFLVISVGNLGRAIPSFGIIGMTFGFFLSAGFGLGFWPIFVALFFLAVPPILTNTYTGISGVDPDTLEAATGMGMTGGQSLLRIELPLAASVIAAGIRTAAVQVVATATLGALVGGGTLGLYIVRGFRTHDDVQVLGGAILVAGLAIVTELVLGLVERLVRPRTASRGARRGIRPGEHEPAVATTHG
jgi:osmoprotectant transport system permease protein